MTIRLHGIGCGGIGTQLIENLVKLSITHTFFEQGVEFHLYDGDYYELKNLSRQIFSPELEGENKAVVTAERLATIYPNIAFKPHHVFLDTQKFLDILNNMSGYGFDIFIIAIDNQIGRYDIINAIDLSKRNHLTILPGNDFRTATCAWYASNDGVVVPCHPFDHIDNYANPTDKPRGNCAYEVVSHPQLLNANMAAALMSMEIIYNYVEGLPLPLRADYNGGKIICATQGSYKSYARENQYD